MRLSQCFRLALIAALLGGMNGLQAAELAPAPGHRVMDIPLSAGVSAEGRGLSNDIGQADAMVRANPEDPEAWFLVGVAYSRTPYLERSLEALQKAKNTARKHPDGLKVFDKKIVEYEKMAAADPDNPLLLYRMAFGYYFRGFATQYGYIKDNSQPDVFYAKAEKAMRRVIELEPSDTAARDYLGFFLAERGRVDEAIALWEETLKRDPRDPGAYMLLGQYYIQTGDLLKAMQYSTQGLKIRNEWLKAHKVDDKYTFGRY